MATHGLESHGSARPGGRVGDGGTGAGDVPTHERLILVSEGGPDEVEDALVRIAKALDFEVVVVDPDPQLTEPPDRLVRKAIPDPVALALGPRDSIVLLTRGERDIEILRAIAGIPLQFVGLWSDGDRAEKNRTELAEQGVSPEFLARLHAPVAGDSRFRAPSEIALAILSEVVDGNGPHPGRVPDRATHSRRLRRRA